MSELAADFAAVTWETLFDVAPIAGILVFFQLVVVRRNPPHFGRILLGFGYVVLGLAMFLVGLREALFPLGEIMARQLTDPAFIRGDGGGAFVPHWHDYLWVYAFAAAIGFATTLVEPSLLAVAIKAHHVSGGGVTVWGLRIAVAAGVAVGVAIGTFRIVTGTPLNLYIIVGYLLVVWQTIYSERAIVPLAYDSGGVTTSTVTVPLVTALGLGLASTIPGRSPLLDGFGLIAFASLFPMIAVMGYVKITAAWRRRHEQRRET